MTAIIRIIDTIMTVLGRLAMLFVPVILVLILAEIGHRAIVGRSLTFVEDLASWLLVAMVFLGGPPTLLWGKFVRVDAAHEHYSPLAKALLDTFVTTALMVCFLYAMIWLGTNFAMKSFNTGEISATGSWNGPVWVAKALVPLGSALLGLAWISHVLKLWQDVRTAKSETAR
ncbi:TRAP transporter small permease subunit [Chachezhania sediminis]|uniref:TRAP transporter small permease subunit n=1 Tax=Chachezhania sediminis TaxID=2599291 RepID=UPI00131C0184|nr:TRAP transporter small permease subunit [Chachezhania sediminis]